MTKRQDLYLQRRSRSEQSDQRQPDQAANISHQPRASPNSTPLASRIEFPTMTAGTAPSNVYVYFASKLEIVLAIYEPWFKRKILALEKAVAKKKTREQKI